MIHTQLLALGVAALFAAPATAQEATPSPMTQPHDWGALLKQDATAAHAAIIDSHPGVQDSLNPGFRSQADAGLAVALERAKTASTAGGWWWALRGFIASFDDGHVQLGLTDPSWSFPTRWPGFLTAYRGDDAVVATRDESDASTPPVGARLLDCDGVSAADLGAQRIGAFRGRWFLEAQKVSFGDWLFLSAQNPWISEMRTCRFETGGRAASYDLAWRPLEGDALRARRTAAGRQPSIDFGFRRLPDGGYRLAMPSFDGDPSGEAFPALTALLAEAEAKQAELRAAPYVMLDLRGNGGGSSHWSQHIARTLWGDDWLSAHGEAPIQGIEWRASQANLDAIRAYLAEWRAAGVPEDDERMVWGLRIEAGMVAAMAEDKPYWSDMAAPPDGSMAAPEAADPPLLMQGPVYVITEAGCGSACLDAVDLWKAAGAVQVGRETSADTVYMDVRDQALPSGLARMAIPMKVWRGRARGNNEPQTPARLFDGDMADDDALMAWIAALPR
ncbi:MAG: peptidase S41 [Brevundimonas sp.]|nr:MAG: peptidase S41 [Brevundimonas sp.]